MTEFTDTLLTYISDVDEAAAAGRVAKLKNRHPDMTQAELVNQLIKRKCLQTGSIGAVTSSAAVIPGIGTMLSLTFGVAADIGATFKLQAELVLEIAAVYEHELTPAEKRTVILAVTGISAGGNQLLQQAGTKLAEQATQRLTQKSILKAIPLLGIAASGGANVLSTYVIGQRAEAYFSLGPDEMQSWSESLRAISGIDERKLVDWLGETTENSWLLLQNGANHVANTAVIAGEKTGKVLLLGANKTKSTLAEAGTKLSEGAVTVRETAVSRAGEFLSKFKRDQTDPDEDDPAAQPKPKDDPEENTLLHRLRDRFKRSQDPDLAEAEAIILGFIQIDDDLESEVNQEDIDKETLFARMWGLFSRKDRDDAQLPADADIEMVVVTEEDGENRPETAAPPTVKTRLLGMFHRKNSEESAPAPDKLRPPISHVSSTSSTLTVELVDGRTLTIPLSWFPRLTHASSQERHNWHLTDNRSRIHWPDIDQTIHITDLLLGQPANESQKSLQKWLDSRQ